MTLATMKRRLDAVERRSGYVGDGERHDTNPMAWSRSLWATCFVDYREWRLDFRNAPPEALEAEISRRTNEAGLRAFLADLAAAPTPEAAMTRLAARVQLDHRGQPRWCAETTGYCWSTYEWDVSLGYFGKEYHGDVPELTNEERRDLVRRCVARDWASGRIALPPWERQDERKTYERTPHAES